ncbi:MAG: LegC family aminotransferase [Chitinophagales bacterium]|nr:LegC family aminotransferase [Chitinophagales bacterium]
MMANIELYAEIVQFVKELYPEKKFVGLHEPQFKGNEKKYLIDAIDSTFVSSVGKYVDRFEQSIKDYTGAKYAVATVNGTSALHIALMLAGVNEGDLVITQPLSFVATCNAISYTKASPLFIDVETKSLGLSAEKLKYFFSNDTIIVDGVCIHKATGKRVAACVPMHTFGFPSDIDNIVDLCSQNLIPVIEDAAESIGSLYKGKHTGTFGLIGTFSFNGNKTITSGGGGLITTNDEHIALKAKHLTTQAKKQHKWAFDHDEIGYNYRMPNINAALACAQLEQLDEYINNKRETAEKYKSFFKQFNTVDFIEEQSFCRSNYWLNAVRFKDNIMQQEFLAYSNDNGVMTRPSWNLLNTLAMFSNCIKGDLSQAESIFNTLVNLPSSVRN